MKLKIVRENEVGIFRHKGFEYVIDRKAIYTKRLFGIRKIFWSMYLEGNPNPIVFDDKGYTIGVSDVPIDEIALLMRKVMRGVMDILLIILVVFNLIVSIVLAGYVMNNGGL